LNLERQWDIEYHLLQVRIIVVVSIQSNLSRQSIDTCQISNACTNDYLLDNGGIATSVDQYEPFERTIDLVVRTAIVVVEVTAPRGSLLLVIK
jgi:hypothetical protein